MIGSAPRTSYVYTTTASSSYWASALTRGPGIRENLATSRGNFRGMLPTLLLGPLAWPGPLIHVHALLVRAIPSLAPWVENLTKLQKSWSSPLCQGLDCF